MSLLPNKKRSRLQIEWTAVLAILLTFLASSFTLTFAVAEEAGIRPWSAAANLLESENQESSANAQSQVNRPVTVQQEEATFEEVQPWSEVLLEGFVLGEDALDDGLYTTLLLGTNGMHTDTIMMLVVNPEKQKISLFSIPRDLAVKGQRINEYFSQYGIESLKAEILELTDLNVDRYLKVDLQGFKDIVNLLGGVEVTVEETIVDDKYPNEKGGTQVYQITPGVYTMNGEEALKYARSRKSTSDFDRAARQQAVLKGLKQGLEAQLKLDGLEVLADMVKTVLEHTESDIGALEALKLYHNYQDYALMTGFVLSSENYLYPQINEAGAYILLPRKGNYDLIHKVIATLVK